jgi:hypothetical protein
MKFLLIKRPIYIVMYYDSNFYDEYKASLSVLWNIISNVKPMSLGYKFIFDIPFSNYRDILALIIYEMIKINRTVKLILEKLMMTDKHSYRCQHTSQC